MLLSGTSRQSFLLFLNKSCIRYSRTALGFCICIFNIYQFYYICDLRNDGESCTQYCEQSSF